MPRDLPVSLLLALALMGGCTTRLSRPTEAHPGDPTDAQLEADRGHRSAPDGRQGELTPEQTNIACAAMRFILGRYDTTSTVSRCLPPGWSVDALAVGPGGGRARVEIGHHGSDGRYPWTGWKLWLTKGANGVWRVTRHWHGDIA